jgi:hypothetical protein
MIPAEFARSPLGKAIFLPDLPVQQNGKQYFSRICPFRKMGSNISPGFTLSTKWKAIFLSN